jgi:hypothetical protein
VILVIDAEGISRFGHIAIDHRTTKGEERMFDIGPFGHGSTRCHELYDQRAGKKPEGDASQKTHTKLRIAIIHAV